MAGLNDRPSSERLHIVFFGLRNAGKSSVVNAVTGQRLSLVSDIKGTTTDPVQKAMELLPVGPVVIIDTPGIDDEGKLGEMRVLRAKQALEGTDIAVLVVDAVKGMQSADNDMEALFREKRIPYIIAMNKCDLSAADRILSKQAAVPAEQEETVLAGDRANEAKSAVAPHIIKISAATGENIYELKELIGKLAGQEKNEKQLAGDIINRGDLVVLVTPIDESAPKGRMILPQQQMIRDVLDNGAINIVVKETELTAALESLKQKPAIVITDSQAFGKVSRIVPDDILLTSFSILFARYKGELEEAVKGAAVLDRLEDGDKVLISEGCTHHRQCNDIGTVKLPGWIDSYTGKKLQYEYTSGREFPDDPSGYALVIHCGACMLTEREMKSRIHRSRKADVPVTNYGIAIAQMHGILKRSLSPFPELLAHMEQADRPVTDA